MKTYFDHEGTRDFTDQEIEKMNVRANEIMENDHRADEEHEEYDPDYVPHVTENIISNWRMI